MDIELAPRVRTTARIDPPLPIEVPDAPPEDLLHRHFSGKRGAERILCAQVAVLHGRRGHVPGVVHDVSAGGFLAEVLGDEFVAAVTEARIGEAIALTEEHFRGGLRVWFYGPDGKSAPVSADAEVVRIAVEPEMRGGIRVGCRFLSMPDAPARRALGLAPTARAAVGRVPRPGPTVYALVYPASGRVQGPLCAGRVLEVSDARLTLRVEGPAADGGLAERLGAPEVRTALWSAGRSFGETDGRVVAVRPDPAAPGTVAVEVDLAGPLPRAAERRFRRV